MEPASPSTLPPSGSNEPVKKDNTKLKIVTAVMSVVAICGVGFSVFQVIESNKNNEKINNLEAEISALKGESEEPVAEEAQSSDDPAVVSDNTGSTSNTGNTSTTAKKYLEPAGWNVRFAYPDGVTDVKYEVDDNYDGEFYIYSITKGGKTYDVNMCGGKGKYGQIPFLLGDVARWNPNGSHESWDSSPANYEGWTLALKDGRYEYYTDANGHGCATGDDSADYTEALRLSRVLLNNIEIKK